MAKPRCPGWRRRAARRAALERRGADWEARRGPNASPASLPPSANPPAAPKPVGKEPTGRTPPAQRGRLGGCAKAAALGAALREGAPALWAFVRVEGVEPTNTAAARAWRPAVRWRKRSQGRRRDAGSRLVERAC